MRNVMSSVEITIFQERINEVNWSLLIQHKIDQFGMNRKLDYFKQVQYRPVMNHLLQTFIK